MFKNRKVAKADKGIHQFRGLPMSTIGYSLPTAVPNIHLHKTWAKEAGNDNWQETLPGSQAIQKPGQTSAA